MNMADHRYLQRLKSERPSMSMLAGRIASTMAASRGTDIMRLDKDGRSVRRALRKLDQKTGAMLHLDKRDASSCADGNGTSYG